MDDTGCGGTIQAAPGLSLHADPAGSFAAALPRHEKAIAEALGPGPARRLADLTAQLRSAHGRMAFFARHASAHA